MCAPRNKKKRSEKSLCFPSFFFHGHRCAGFSLSHDTAAETDLDRSRILCKCPNLEGEDAASLPRPRVPLGTRLSHPRWIISASFWAPRSATWCLRSRRRTTARASLNWSTYAHHPSLPASLPPSVLVSLLLLPGALQLITLYGHDAYLYLLRCLMEQIDLKDSAKSQQRFQLLQQQLLQLIDKPNFPSVLFQALSGLELKEDFLNQLSKALKLNLAQDIVLALGLAQAPEKSIRHEGNPPPHSHIQCDFSFFNF